MTTSALLLASIRQQALTGPDSGSRFAMDVLKLCDEYEIAVKQALALERSIHELTKEKA